MAAVTVLGRGLRQLAEEATKQFKSSQGKKESGNREITRESSEPRPKNKSLGVGCQCCQPTEVQGLAPQEVTLALARSKGT